MMIKMFLAVAVLFWCSSCSNAPKAKPRVPLAVKPPAPTLVVQRTAQGTQEYQQGQYNQAKSHFEEALAGAPDSAEAHYNLGLALFALGDNEQARQHFIEAANLAPGDKVIWDSPALRQYGNPDSNIPKQAKDPQYSNQRPSFGGGPRR
jgi:Tfp pilus assembly protein PilF